MPLLLVCWIFTLPELPEVETIVRTLAPHVLDCRIEAVNLLHPKSAHPQSLPLENMVCSTICGARRRGKLILLDLASDKKTDPETLVIHLRMTGSFLPKAHAAAPGKHTRCIFTLADKSGKLQDLFFDDIRTFGKILLANAEILENWPFWRELGPEPLEIDAAALKGRLKGKRHLKAALLDQKTIAGIGNIYADEALFQAGLHPCRNADSLDMTECERLHAAIRDVLLRSIAQCGSSIRDYKDADGNAGAFQNSFKVYGKGGEKCVICGSVLQKSKVGGRATVFCPHCQRLASNS